MRNGFHGHRLTTRQGMPAWTIGMLVCAGFALCGGRIAQQGSEA